MATFGEIFCLKDDEPMHVSSTPKSSLAPSAIVLLAMGCFGLVFIEGQEASKSSTNVWTAPSRAARKENPTPADDKSRARGKELFTAGCRSEEHTSELHSHSFI